MSVNVPNPNGPKEVFVDHGIVIPNLVFDPPRTISNLQNYRLTSVQSLLAETKPKEYSPRHTAIVGMIMNIRSAWASNSKNKVHTRQQKVSSRDKDNIVDKPYDKMMSCMCVSSAPGSNSFIVLIKSGENADHVFSTNIAACDHPNENGFGPGSLVMIRVPAAVTETFGDAEHGIPILDFPGSFYLIDKYRSNIRLKDTPQHELSHKLGCFFLKGCRIRVVKFTLRNVPCKGELCDAVDLLRGNANNYKGCACYGQNYFNSSLLINLSLLITYGGNSFTSDFMSRKMTNRLTRGGIPKGTHLETIELSGIDDDMWENANRFFDMGNQDRDGFTVAGWFRPGMIVDQGSNPEKKTNVSAAHYNNHVTLIDFPAGWRTLNEHCSDVTAMLYERAAEAETVEIDD